MNSIMMFDDVSEESEFLSANASLESFVHKALKYEQRECIHRIVCHGRDVLAVLPTGLGKSTIRERYISVNFKFKCCFVWANATSKTTAEPFVFCWLTKWSGTFTKFCF